MNQEGSLRAHLVRHRVGRVPEDVLDQVLPLARVRDLPPRGQEHGSVNVKPIN